MKGKASTLTLETRETIGNSLRMAIFGVLLKTDKPPPLVSLITCNVAVNCLTRVRGLCSSRWQEEPIVNKWRGVGGDR
jgi:hypothetical protein